MNLALKVHQPRRTRKTTRPPYSPAKWLLGLAFVVLISWVAYVPPPEIIADPHLREGNIAPTDITVNIETTVVDEPQTEKKRQETLSILIPYYIRHGEIARENLERVQSWLVFFREMRRGYFRQSMGLDALQEEIRSRFGLNPPESETVFMLQSGFFLRCDAEALIRTIQQATARGLILARAGIRQGPGEMIRVIDANGGQYLDKTISLCDFADLRRILTEFCQTQKLAARETETAVNLLLELVSPDILYSSLHNREQEEKALQGVPQVTRSFRKGEVVIKRGEEMTVERMQVLHMLLQAERERRRPLSGFFLVLVILLFILLFLWKFYETHPAPGLNPRKITIVMGSTLLVSALVYRLLLFFYPLATRSLFLSPDPGFQVVHYAVPFGIGALVIAFLFDLQSAVIYSFINAVVSGIICNWDFKLMLFVLVGNIALSLGIERYQRLKRTPILKAGFFWLIPINSVLILMITLEAGHARWLMLGYHLLLGLAGALLAMLIANFLIPLWEASFRLLTDLKLVEITNLNLPVFRDMLERAPGTYHHSLMVASLAESVGTELGISPLLLRAMALYHDIGKNDSPQFFTENQAVYENPHAKLSPLESAKNIIAHISNGMEQAERLKLPQKVKRGIVAHHGTKLVKFFYEKARAGAEGEDVAEDLFRYPGSRPQDIEEAVIMLADQIEAASKSLTAPGDDEIRNVIEQIIAANIADNQFDECNHLTFKALHTIAENFFNKLTSIYHQRVAYPGFNFSKKEQHD